jgi:tRNA pseudouridine55 synthase
VRGFLLVDKPRGPTSHDIVDVVRRVLGVKRVGHAGTLDPLASGLLVLAAGPATRLLSYVQGLRKTYDVTASLGVTTTTLDSDGDVVERRDVGITPAQVREAAVGLLGEIDQTPPAVSAVKVSGERAYRKAARGEEVELFPRRVTVHSFDVLRTSPMAFDARVVCSSGTYVRSLVRDVGEALGCGAHVAALRRTHIGHLEVKEAIKPDGLVASSVMRVEDVLTQLERLDVGVEQERMALNGRKIEASAPDGEVLVVGPSGAVGVFEASAGILRPAVVLPAEPLTRGPNQASGKGSGRRPAPT